MSRSPAPRAPETAPLPLLGLVDGLTDRRIETRKLMRDAARALRLHLGLEVGFVSRMDAAVRKLIAVDVRPGCEPVAEAANIRIGREDPVEKTFCHRVLKGDFPNALENAMDHPVAGSILRAAGGVVGGYVNVPIRLADGSLYGTICCFSAASEPGLGRRDVEIMNLVADLLSRRLERDAEATRGTRDFKRKLARTIEESRLTFVTQPIVDLRSRRVIGRELLCRLELFEDAGPEPILARARDLGLGDALEKTILAAAARRSQAAPADGSALFLNLSPRLAADPDVRRILEGARSPVVLEMTETLAYAVDDATLAALADLRAAGVRIAVDDFGVGYANLEALTRIRPDFIKLARALVRRIGSDAALGAVVVGLLAFAAATGATVVAEGVETEEEARRMTALGIDLAQGWAFGRPEPEALPPAG